MANSRFKNIIIQMIADSSTEIPKNILKKSGWHCYQALVNGIPAAAGGLYVNSGKAFLALSSTVPSLRNHGCQKALLYRRIATAALDCELIVSGALPGSISLYNMYKVGLRLAYNKSIWLQRSWRQFRV